MVHEEEKKKLKIWFTLCTVYIKLAIGKKKKKDSQSDYKMNIYTYICIFVKKYLNEVVIVHYIHLIVDVQFFLVYF
jgi:hypothetical protein